jgi:hypothetical protein
MPVSQFPTLPPKIAATTVGKIDGTLMGKPGESRGFKRTHQSGIFTIKKGD